MCSSDLMPRVDTNTVGTENVSNLLHNVVAMGFTKNELGFTGHGFRHSFAHQELEANGFIAAIKGRSIAVIGTIDKATGQAVALKDKDRLLVARALTSRQLGHSRVSITGAYYGSHRIAAVAAAVTNSVSRVDHAEKV